jgi:TRAP-type C4-dicarboxylate transport system permease small subunit
VSLPLPEPMTPDQWEHVTQTLILLWLFVVTMVLLAGSMMVAHILIPSLIETQHLSPAFNKVRPVIYGIAALAFIGVVFVFANFVINLEEFREIYPGTWI